MQEVLRISISRESKIESEEKLMIEQADYDEYTGKITKANMLRYISSMLYPTASNSYNSDEIPSLLQAEAVFDCGIDSEGNLDTAVYVYPYELDLVYSFNVSYGTHGNKTIEEFIHEEYVTFNNSTTASLEYPGQEIKELEWFGKVYKGSALKNAVIAPPSVDLENVSLTTQEAITGSVRLKYRVVRHVYPVSIFSRKENPAMNSESAIFSSVAYCVYTGGIQWEELEAPYGAEDFSSDYGCATNLKVNPNDPAAPPIADESDRIITKDYCTGETKSDKTL